MNFVVTLEITVEAKNRKEALNKVDELLKDIPGVLLYNAEFVPDFSTDSREAGLENVTFSRDEYPS